MTGMVNVVGLLGFEPLAFLGDTLLALRSTLLADRDNGRAEQYLRAAHIVPMPYSVAHRGVVDTHLASLNLSRSATVVLPYFSMALYLLPGTDLVFTTSRHFARHFAKFLPLEILPPPFEFPRMRFYQLWHERTHQVDSHRWLRTLIRETCAQAPYGVDIRDS
mgnify:CR=1 FL=1